MRFGNPNDNHTRMMVLEREQGEIYHALMELKHGNLTFTDFVSFCRSFNPDATIDDIAKAVQNS